MFEFLGHKFTKAERKTINFDIPSFYGMLDTQIPVHVQHSGKKGPIVLVTSLIHGDEINGMRISQFLINKKKFRILKGTLIIVPVVNLYGFLNKTRYLPDRKDLNRFFPGSTKGSFGSRFANHILQNIGLKADIILDLHSGGLGRYNIPQIRCDFKTQNIFDLLDNVEIPLIVNSSIRDGSFRESLFQAGKTCLVFEGGEGLRFDSQITKHGVNFITSVLKYYGMIEGKTLKSVKDKLIINKTRWIRASESGIIINKFKIGKIVEKNNIFGEIKNLEGKLKAKIKSPADGIVLGMHMNPLVMSGDALYHVGFIDDKTELDHDNYDWAEFDDLV